MSTFTRRLLFAVGTVFSALPLLATPDLFLKAFTADPSGGAGLNVHYSLSIVNQGTGGRAAFSTAEMRLSSSNVAPSVGDPLLLSIFVGDLAPGETLNASGTTIPIPANQSPGAYYIWVSLDVNGSAGQSAGDQANDRSKLAFTVTGTPGPDLIPQSFSASPSGDAGSNVSYSVTIQNQGTGPAASSITEFRLSDSSVAPSTSDPVLLSLSTPAINAGGSTSLNGSNLPIPANAGLGTKYVWVILDATGSAGQGTTNQANDRAKATFTVTGASLPDLVTQSLSVNPLSGTAGSGIAILYTIVNQGTATANPSHAEIRLSTSSVAPSNNDPVLYSFQTDSIPPSGFIHFGTTLSLPADTSLGTKYVWISLDLDNAAGQGAANKTNDRSSTVFTVVALAVPVASFTWSPQSPSAGQPVQFTDTSTGSPTSWAWNFGDGTIGPEKFVQNPVHTYPYADPYYVSLIATNASGSNTSSTFMITVGNPPPAKLVASFTWSPQSPSAGQPVQFTDTSTGSPTSWAWNFGDGSNGADKFLQNPSHTYTFPGPYFISLIATNASGSNTSSTFTVNVGDAPAPKPVASFTLSPSSPKAGQEIQFTDTSNGNPTSWFWTFGDGTTGTSQNPIHVFVSAGNYPVKLAATNAAGADTTTKTVTVAATSTLSITTISFTPPTATVGVGYAAQQAVTATGGETPYTWSASGLPSGMVINATSGAVFGTPTVPGTFNVTVSVQDNGSPKQTASKVLAITVAPAQDCLTLSLSATPSNGGSVIIHPLASCYSAAAVLTLTATPATGFEFSAWSPSGIVLASNSSASTTGHLTGPASITASFRALGQPPAPFFDFQPPNPRIGEIIEFTDQSTGAPTSWSWDFDGDGSADAQGKFSEFSYSHVGTYIVRLTVGNSHGSATTTRSVTVAEASRPLEFVDPNPHFLVGRAVTTDPQRLATGGRTVFGASADGVTRVLVRSVVRSPGSVTFSLVTKSVQNDGALSNPLTTDHQQYTTLSVPAVAVANSYVAFALYVPPADFNMSGNSNAGDAMRIVHLSATFHPTNGSSNGSTEQDFYLIRPPLFLIHGIWSDATTWTLPPVHDSRWSGNITPASYGTTHAADFGTNEPIVQKQLRDFISSIRSGFRVGPGQVGIAVTQVDVVAHSMGGLLARMTWEPRDDNYRAGDIHKLITLDSPHFGSDEAYSLEALRNSPLNIDLPEYLLIAEAMKAIGHDITGGAVKDLATGSFAIGSLPGTGIPSHAIVGAPTITTLCDRDLYPLLLFLLGIDPFTLFSENDGLVTRTSQEGGLPIGAADAPVRTDDGCHTHNTGSVFYSDRVIDLLNTPVTDTSTFGHFPSNGAAVKRSSLNDRLPAKATQIGSLSIVHGRLHLNLVPKSSVSGSVIGASVRSTDQITKVLYLAKGTAASSDIGPDFVADLPVPIGTLDTMSVQAFAVGPENTYYDSEVVDVVLASPGMPQDLTVTPQLVQMTQVGETRQISIAALYPDLAWRDVTGSQNAVYATSAPEVVSVSAGGLLVARGPGSARVAISYGTLQSYIQVRVLTAGRRRAVSP